jgi:hypothetical protein
MTELWGAIRDPVRNIWVVEFGIIACLAIVPFVLVFGRLRGIPWFWQCVDMSFGLFGLVPLWVARSHHRPAASLQDSNPRAGRKRGFVEKAFLQKIHAMSSAGRRANMLCARSMAFAPGARHADCSPLSRLGSGLS